MANARPQTTPSTTLHLPLSNPLEKQYTLTNHMAARGRSVTAICANPNRFGMTITARAENNPAARPKRSAVHEYMQLTSNAKNNAGPRR